MKLSKVEWVRIGDFIKPRIERNSELLYGVDRIEGVTSAGVFAPTRANTENINLRPYKIVRKGDFAYNPSRLNIGSIAYYTNRDFCIVSHLYHIFHIREDKRDKILPDYLYIFFRRPEFFRLIDYLNYGSQRAEFGYNQFAELELPLPSIEEQQTIVDAWKSLSDIKDQNEALAAPLMQLCQSYIQECKHKFPWRSIGSYITSSDERNKGGKYSTLDVRGVSIQKEFIPTKANMDNVPVTSYKVVRKGMFAFNPNTARMGDKFSIALNQTENVYLVSSIYPVFSADESVINSNYLKMWFNRVDFDRYTRYHSWGSAREMFNYSDMERVKIPLPPIEVQVAIVSLYQCALEYKKIAAEADAQLRSICSALMQHAINS